MVLRARYIWGVRWKKLQCEYDAGDATFMHGFNWMAQIGFYR